MSFARDEWGRPIISIVREGNRAVPCQPMYTDVAVPEEDKKDNTDKSES